MVCCLQRLESLVNLSVCKFCSFKKINSFSEKQLGMLSKTNFGPLLSQKVKRKVQDALDRFKKPSRQKGGGMATRGMGAALRGGGMALRGMGAAYKKK
jgi:hypothetical protein